MSQATTIKPFNVAANLTVPSTPDEYDSLAKKSGKCLEDALKYYLYHVYFSELRDVILHGREEVKDEQGNIVLSAIAGMDEIYGVERREKPVLGKDDKPLVRDGKPVMQWDEKEEAYFNRILAEKKLTTASQEIINHVQNVVNNLAVDPSVAERQPRAPKKLAKEWSQAAEQILNAGEGQVAKVNKKFADSIGKTFTAVGDKAKDVETLGWLVKEYSAWFAKQSLAKLGVGVGGE